MILPAAILIAVATAIAMPAPPPATAASAADIVVRATAPGRDERIAHAVQAIGLPVPQGNFDAQYARWDEPVCVTVAGMARAFDALIADRIGQVAREVGAKALGPGCQPNLYVIVTPDVPGLIARSRVSRAGLLNGLSAYEVRHLERSGAAVRWAATTGIASGQGDRLHKSNGEDAPPTLFLWSSSHITASTQIRLKQMVVFVDAKQVTGVTAGQLADYLALVSLAQMNPDPQAPMVDTILSLFPQRAGNTPPAGLTAFDHAYLNALYRIAPNDHGDVQRQAIAWRVQQALGHAPAP